MPAGFVLPVVLGIILLAGLFAMHATTDAGTTMLLANQRQLQQAAFEAAESGAVAVAEQLAAGAAPQPVQHLDSGTPDRPVTVQTVVTARMMTAAGFSAGRVSSTDYEIRSTGRSVRRSEVTIVEGLRQMRAATAP